MTPYTMPEIDALVAAIDAERLRLGWNLVKCSKFLKQHFDKSSRWLLTDKELTQALALFKEQERRDDMTIDEVKALLQDNGVEVLREESASCLICDEGRVIWGQGWDGYRWLSGTSHIDYILRRAQR